MHAQEEASEDVKNPDTIVYVDGLACLFCAYGIEKKLDDLDHDLTKRLSPDVGADPHDDCRRPLAARGWPPGSGPSRRVS